ncbi:MAG: hypothetical protein P1U34_10120 [Coxiellaceae bacterium]|nr:hypothetical protein [Coxiellaceae bacterium]
MSRLSHVEKVVIIAKAASGSFRPYSVQARDLMAEIERRDDIVHAFTYGAHQAQQPHAMAYNRQFNSLKPGQTVSLPGFGMSPTGQAAILKALLNIVSKEKPELLARIRLVPMIMQKKYCCFFAGAVPKPGQESTDRAQVLERDIRELLESGPNVVIRGLANETTPAEKLAQIGGGDTSKDKNAVPHANKMHEVLVRANQPGFLERGPSASVSGPLLTPSK